MAFSVVRVYSSSYSANGTILIATGADAWDWARCWDAGTRRAFLCLPAGVDPESFDWRTVAGFDVAVFIFGEIAEGIPDRLAALASRRCATSGRLLRRSGGRVTFWDRFFRPLQSQRAAA